MSELSEKRQGSLTASGASPPVPTLLMVQEPRMPTDDTGKPGHSAPTLEGMGDTSQVLTFENLYKYWHSHGRDTMRAQGGPDTVPVLRQLTVWMGQRSSHRSPQRRAKAEDT